MPTYAIGDVQGCFDELQALLAQCAFEAGRDQLWFVGDLVNRGPRSLEVLRFVKGLGNSAVTVLGNHDLHLVTQHEGFERPRKDDTFQDVLKAPDAKELVGWLRTRPMMHADGDWAMVHAGLLPRWSIQKALSLGKEVEAALAAPDYREFRRLWIDIVQLAAQYDPVLFRQLMQYPDDLPDLSLLRPPHNTRPEGVRESFRARRDRGQLPETY